MREIFDKPALSHDQLPFAGCCRNGLSLDLQVNLGYNGDTHSTSFWKETGL